MKLKKFTLLELLIVIAIILLLMSFLIPGMTRAKRTAELVQCQNNLKGLGLATTNMLNDNKRFFPTNNYYQYLSPNYNNNALYKYLGTDRLKIRHCPADSDSNLDAISYRAGASEENHPWDNDLNAEYEGYQDDPLNPGHPDPKKRGLKLSKILRPTTYSLFTSEKAFALETYMLNDRTNWWHDPDAPRFPYLSIGLSTKVVRYENAMWYTNAFVDIIDFHNEP